VQIEPLPIDKKQKKGLKTAHNNKKKLLTFKKTVQKSFKRDKRGNFWQKARKKNQIRLVFRL